MWFAQTVIVFALINAEVPVMSIKKTGTFKGKSNKLGHGGRAAQLRSEGVPGESSADARARRRLHLGRRTTTEANEGSDHQ